MALFEKELEIPLIAKERFPFQELHKLSDEYFLSLVKKEQVKSVDSSLILSQFLVNLELPLQEDNEDKTYKELRRDYAFYLNLFEMTILLPDQKESSDIVLNQVMQLRALLPQGYEQFYLQNLLILYYLTYQKDLILKHAKIERELSDYVAQDSFNLLAFYSRGLYFSLLENWDKSLDDFLHVFKYQTRYYQIFDKLTLCLRHLQLEEVNIIESYRLSEDLRFVQAKVQESLLVSETLLKKKSRVYEKLRVENLHNRGHSLKNIVKDFEQARDHFQKILVLDEKERKEQAYYNLIMIELNTQNFDQCAQYIIQLNDEFPMTDYRVKTNLISLYLSIMKTIK